MFPNGNVGLENSKFYEDVPDRGHLIGRAATGSCPKGTLVTPTGHELLSFSPIYKLTCCNYMIISFDR